VRVLAVVTAALVIPATLTLPVAGSMAGDPEPVRAEVVTIPLDGIDSGALAATPAEERDEEALYERLGAIEELQAEAAAFERAARARSAEAARQFHAFFPSARE
jgi:hypothetical protein